jgi:hypothetical protein
MQMPSAIANGSKLLPLISLVICLLHTAACTGLVSSALMT